MKRQWDIEDLIEHFTLVEDDLKILANKTGATRLGCALLLKCCQLEGHFPNAKHEIPRSVLDYIAHQLKLPSALFSEYDWQGHTIKLHRTQIREELGFREATAADSDALSAWLITTQLAADQNLDHLTVKVLAELRERKIEPPTSERVERLIRSACATYEQTLCIQVMQRLAPQTRILLDGLLERSVVIEEQDEQAEDEQPTQETARREIITWQDLKTNPGAVGLESVLYEIDKLRVLSQLALPADLFGEASPHVITLYRQRAATETLYELRRHPDATRYTYLAAFCLQRAAEVTDSLVDLLLLVVHRIGAKAEKRVGKQFLDEVRRVDNKPRLLYQMADAAVAHPEKTIRAGIFSAVSEEQCKAIVKEYKAKGSYQQQVYLKMRSSYRDHYRRMVPRLLNMLDVRSSNSMHQPVVRALILFKRYAGPPGIFYPLDEEGPIEGVVRPMWQEVVVEKDKDGEQRINRVNYELCVLEALREGLRCRELWIVGANKYRNPDDDLPKDFEEKRKEYYAALGQPNEAKAFVDALQQQMIAALESFDRALPKLAPKVRILEKNGGWIYLSPLEALDEPQNLRKLKAEINRRWGMTNLLDILSTAWACSITIVYLYIHFLAPSRLRSPLI